MKKSIAKKKSFLVSLGAFATCCAMLVGSTFAWFTDSAESGNNTIVAGNLHIQLEHKDENGDFKPVDSTQENGTYLSPEGGLWEPGKMTFEEFQIKNIGNLALKFGVGLKADYNCISEDNPYYNEGEDEPEFVYEKSLADKVFIAVYRGSWEDFVKEFGEELQDSEDLTEDQKRELVKKAIDDGILKFVPFYSHGIYISALAPAGEENGIDITFNKGLGDYEYLPNGKGDTVQPGEDDSLTLTGVTDSEVFTVFAYWEPSTYGYYEDGEFIPTGPDDDYNLNNGKKATTQMYSELYPDDEDAEPVESPDDEDAEPVEPPLGATELKIEFQIFVEAGQAPYESDSFGDQYDFDAELPNDPDLDDEPLLP